MGPSVVPLDAEAGGSVETSLANTVRSDLKTGVGFTFSVGFSETFML